jgi:tetrahydromethanopterin S-methyltransferase subunit G
MTRMDTRLTGRIEKLEGSVDARFNKVDDRFDKIDAKLHVIHGSTIAVLVAVVGVAAAGHLWPG